MENWQKGLAWAGGIGAAGLLLTRGTRMKALAQNLDYAIALRVHKLWPLTLAADVTLDNPTSGSVVVSHPYVRMFRTEADEKAGSTFARSVPQDKSYTIGRRGRTKIEGILFEIGLSTIPEVYALLREIFSKNGGQIITTARVTINGSAPINLRQVTALKNPFPGLLSLGMVATGKRLLQAGGEYDALITKAGNTLRRVDMNADTADTVRLVQQVIEEYHAEVAPLAEKLRGNSLRQTCQNIWNFIYRHVQYTLDPAGKEWIRTPARIWADRVNGDDCDGYATFAGALLRNLGIAFHLRVTAYKGNWQHIYIVVPVSGNRAEKLNQSARSRYIVIDPVTDAFDYEVPYSRKMDSTMELSLLGGLPTSDAIGELGLFNIGKKAKAKTAARQAATKLGENSAPERKTAVGKFLQKASKAVVKVVVSPLRNVWLLAMKSNALSIAKKLRWAYATPEAAAKAGYSKAKWQKLYEQAIKTQNTFVKTGGEAKNLKAAILNGKGNSDKKVLAGLPLSGLAGICCPSSLGYVAALGDYEEFYDQQALETLAGLNGLGVAPLAPALMAIAPALTALAAVLNAIKPDGAAATEEYVDDSGEYYYEDEELEGVGSLKTFFQKIIPPKAERVARKEDKATAKALLAEQGVEKGKVKRQAVKAVKDLGIEIRKAETAGDTATVERLKKEQATLVKSNFANTEIKPLATKKQTTQLAVSDRVKDAKNAAQAVALTRTVKAKGKKTVTETRVAALTPEKKAQLETALADAKAKAGLKPTTSKATAATAAKKPVSTQTVYSPSSAAKSRTSDGSILDPEVYEPEVETLPSALTTSKAIDALNKATRVAQTAAEQYQNVQRQLDQMRQGQSLPRQQTIPQEQPDDGIILRDEDPSSNDKPGDTKPKEGNTGLIVGGLLLGGLLLAAVMGKPSPQPQYVSAPAASLSGVPRRRGKKAAKRKKSPRTPKGKSFTRLDLAA